MAYFIKRLNHVFIYPALLLAFLCSLAHANFLPTAANGNIGIGSTVPRGKLDVDGTVYSSAMMLSSGNTVNAIVTTLSAPTDLQIPTAKAVSAYVAASATNPAMITAQDTTVIVTDTGSNGQVAFNINGSQSMIIDQNGNVGIGSTAPAAKLDINGALRVNNLIGQASEYNNGNSGASLTVNWNNGNKQLVTLTANCTFTFTAPAGVVAGVTLRLIQDGTGSRLVTWPAAVKWPGAAAPVLTTTAAAVDIINCYYNGTNYYCSSALNFN